MSCLIGHSSGIWDTILPPLQSLWERRDHHIVLPKVLCCSGPPSSIWVSCMSECIASARLLCNHGVLPWKDSRSWYMPLLSCAEVLRVGYSNLYLLLDKSILTLFKVVFQAGLFFWRLLCFQMSSIFRTIRLSLTPLNVQVKHMENPWLVYN